MTVENFLTYAVGPGAVAAALILVATRFWGSALIGSYASEFGKNLATKEQFDELLRMQKATTEATAKIEAQVSGGLWMDQQLWSRRVDALLELTDYLVELEGALTRVRTRGTDNEARRAAFWTLSKTIRDARRLEVSKARSVARLLLRPGVMERFEETERRMLRYGYDPSAWPTKPGIEDTHFALEYLSRYAMIDAAREDVMAFRREDQEALRERDDKRRRREFERKVFSDARQPFEKRMTALNAYRALDAIEVADEDLAREIFANIDRPVEEKLAKLAPPESPDHQ